ncbi:hypothetical protein GCM10025778_28810 [Paeniglutamicibacter antarcticus]|uniref:Uncharacterized protein n=1 Tax=Paeniglutamicibacter antarcticus TaxID=494023 RepID=A0ABP9TP29_9MICC
MAREFGRRLAQFTAGDRGTEFLGHRILAALGDTETAALHHRLGMFLAWVAWIFWLSHEVLLCSMDRRPSVDPAHGVKNHLPNPGNGARHTGEPGFVASPS